MNSQIKDLINKKMLTLKNLEILGFEVDMELKKNPIFIYHFNGNKPSSLKSGFIELESGQNLFWEAVNLQELEKIINDGLEIYPSIEKAKGVK